MTRTKNEIIDHIIDVEGGYVNDPSDSGGETMYGITVAVARRNGYFGEMRDLPRDLAFRIYADKYWNALRLDDVAALSDCVAAELADTAVNMGVPRAGQFFQRCLTALNNRGQHYSDLTVDGIVGNKTIAAYDAFMSHRGANAEKILLRALNSLQGAFYIELAERREKDEKFLAGWLLNRVS